MERMSGGVRVPGQQCSNALPLPRLERNRGGLLTVEGEEMGGVRLDDVGNMGAPEEGQWNREEFHGSIRQGRDRKRSMGRRARTGSQILEDWGGSNPTHNESKHERGPCENQSGGSTLDGGEDTTGLATEESFATTRRGRRNALHGQRVCQTRWQMKWNTESTMLHPTEGVKKRSGCSTRATDPLRNPRRRGMSGRVKR